MLHDAKSHKGIKGILITVTVVTLFGFRTNVAYQANMRVLQWVIESSVLESVLIYFCVDVYDLTPR